MSIYTEKIDIEEHKEYVVSLDDDYGKSYCYCAKPIPQYEPDDIETHVIGFYYCNQCGGEMYVREIE